jgi:uncharacterized protein DUF4340
MKGLRSTIVLLVVLVGVGWYAYRLSNKPADTPDSKQEKVFASAQADKIDEIKIKAAAGDVTTLKKTDGAWQIVDPIKVKADESEASGVTSGLTSLNITRVVDENPSDLKEYGLAEPRVDVAFKASGDKDYQHLLIGEKSPTGSDLFARRNGDKKVFLIPAYQETTYNRSTFDLRDKTILKFERDKVDSIEVQTGGKTLQLAKSGADWKVVKPIQARADYGTVEGLIGRLESARMKAITTPEPAPADLKKAGFDKPEAEVTLNMGSARATLVVGAKSDSGDVYVRDSSKPAIMTVESAFADELKKGADDYRRKDVFEFRPFNANRLEITRGGQTIVFEKVKDPAAKPDANQEKWRRASPNPKDADKDKIDSLLSRLSNMRAASFQESTAKTGIDAPAMIVVVKYDDGKKEERVTFGKVDNDAYAARPGEPGVAKIDTTDLTEAMKTLDELAK